LSRQRNWRRWHAYDGVGKATALRLHERLGIPQRGLAMPRAGLPDILTIWGYSWTHTKGRRGWVGPAITDPEEGV
jgi:hypothetical protein